MSDESEREIETILRLYFRGYLEAEAAQIAEAFYPETRLYSSGDAGMLEKTEMADWLRNLEERKVKADLRKAGTEIVSVDVTGSAAAAKVGLTFEKHTFTDYLSLLKIEGAWRIIGKIYQVNARSEGGP